MKTRISMKEVPLDLQEVIKKHGYTARTIDVEACVEFTCPTSWNDFNCVELIMFNRKTQRCKGIKSGHYENFMNFTEEELAMYYGKIFCQLEEHIIAIVLQTYPKNCTVYCHPGIITKAIEQDLALTKEQLLCLFITRAYKASYRPVEARQFNFALNLWEEVKIELYEMKLLTKRGALTTKGVNAARNLRFVPWEDSLSN